MHYGRLQIFKPDEPVENFFIEKDSIAIGRSTGNDLIFERNGVSRYHVSLIVQNQHLVLQDLDSVNGTYVDGIRVRANEQYLLRGGEEIQIGDVRLVFHPVTDAFPPIRADVQTVELGNFKVELESPHIPITPGAHAPATISIENTGFNTEHFFIEVEGVPKEWVRLDRGDFDLLPGAQVQIGINFKPLRRPESTPGEYTITIRAYSQANPEEVATLKTSIHILQFNGYGMVMGTPLIVDNQPFQIYIHNQGNGPLGLNFRGFHKSKLLKFDIHTPVITLQAGQRETIVGNIRPMRRTWFGKPRTYSYDVISHSQDAAGFQAPISGEYMISPVFAQWVLFAGIAGILVGLVALFYFIGTALQPEPVSPKPSVTFALSASQVNFGESVTFDWRAVRASSVRYTVEREDELILSADLPDTEGDDYPIMNLPSAGEYTVTIIAANDDEQQDTTTKTFQVNPNIAEFTATTDRTFYRNVVGQAISIAWDVEGVNDISEQNESPIVLSSNVDYSFEDDYEASYNTQINFPAITTEVVELTLQVNGLDDTVSVETRTIQVVSPICSVTDTTEIYEGPTTYFPDYILLGFLQADTSFQVNSRYFSAENETSNWISIEIPANLGFPDSEGWVDATQITCDSDFDYARLLNLTIDQLPATPRYFDPLELGILRQNRIRQDSIEERGQVTGPNFHTLAIIDGISSSSAREATEATDTAQTSEQSAIMLVAPDTSFRVDLAENDDPSTLRTVLLPFGFETDETSSLPPNDIYARPAPQNIDESLLLTGVFIFTGQYGNPDGGAEIRLDETRENPNSPDSQDIRFKSRGQCMAGEYLTPQTIAFTCYGGDDTECEVQTTQTLAVPGRYTIVDIDTGTILASSDIPYNVALRHYNTIFEVFDDEAQARTLAMACFQIIDQDADGVIDTEDECPEVADGAGADCIVYPDGEEDES